MLVNTGGISERVRCNKTVLSLPRDVHTQSFSPGPVNPSSNENRLIVIHIGSEDGFVPGGLLCVESQKNCKDYHDEINGGFFCDWLGGVLSILKDNAIIIMNNTPYNSAKLEKCPTIDWSKADIVQWLKSKREVIDQSMIILELLENVNRLKPMYSKYIVDEMVRQHNKVVLRLPPYHCGLNPIPLAWSVVKSHIKSNNKTFKLSDVKKLLIEGTEKVDLGMWKNFISHTMKEEETFWNVDSVLDELMEEIKIVIKTR
jgi:transposase